MKKGKNMLKYYSNQALGIFHRAMELSKTLQKKIGVLEEKNTKVSKLDSFSSKYNDLRFV